MRIYGSMAVLVPLLVAATRPPLMAPDEQIPCAPRSIRPESKNFQLLWRNLEANSIQYVIVREVSRLSGTDVIRK
jgi:hypothetical protein